MKKIITAVLLCSIILLSLCSFAPVKTVANQPVNETFDASKVLEARFLNMLNHNFVYNDMFYDDEKLLNESTIALLEVAEDGFLKEIYLKEYVFNMYGKIYDDFSNINVDAPKKDGYFYVVPRGYDLYEHTIISVTDNEDGSYTVVSSVIIDYHFGEKVEAVSTTYFLENELSAFGYNIVFSSLNYPLEYAMAV